MKRLVGTLLGLALLAIGIAFPALTWDFTSSQDAQEPTSISS